MLKEQLNLLYPLAATFLFIAILVLYVYYTSPRHYRFKLLLGPVLLAAGIFVVPSVGARLGYGWPTPLPASFQYVAHNTVIVDGKKKWVDVMLLSQKPLRADARLHRVPWSGDLEKVLEQAQRMKEDPGGGDIMVSGPGTRTKQGMGLPGYSAFRVLPQDRFQKGPPVPTNPGAQPPQQSPLPSERRPDYLTNSPDLGKVRA